jgi:hypothetical protein
VRPLSSRSPAATIVFVHLRHQRIELRLGHLTEFGHIVISEIEVPILLVHLVE